MPNFFVSYTKTDVTWAEWIAWTLEEASFTVALQKWDFRAGSNFVLEMQKAAASSDRTIAVLSSEYLQSGFTAPEWAAAFAHDPRGTGQKLVPVRVAECDPVGLLGPIVYIDLLGKNEADAQEALLAGITPGRGKPTTKPPFPFHSTATAKPFPVPRAADSKPRSVSTKLRLPPSDLDKRRFLREGFSKIAQCFEFYLAELERENQGVATSFDRETSSTVRAEIFVNGRLSANCKIWIGGQFGENAISYAEGSTAIMGNATNEIISIASGDELAFSALMHMGVGQLPPHINLKYMSPDDVPEYLWARFLLRLK